MFVKIIFNEKFLLISKNHHDVIRRTRAFNLQVVNDSKPNHTLILGFFAWCMIPFHLVRYEVSGVCLNMMVSVWAESYICFLFRKAMRTHLVS